MIVLHQFPPFFGLPNASPFCMKLEGFLRLAGLPYRVEPLLDLETAPKRRGPFITEEDGTEIGDSALVIRHLKRSHGVDPDAWLSPEQRAAGLAFRVMLEEHLYFALLYTRWIEDAHWPVVRAAYLGDLPPPVQDAIRERQRERIRAQGLGAHDPEELYALAVGEIDALAAWLGSRRYFMGERASETDCTVLAFTAGLLVPEFDGPLRAAVLGHENLVAYTGRLLRELFP